VENEEKSKKFYYRIGEIAKDLGVATSMLRFWEKEFSQFIEPQRNKRGVRLYSQDDFDLFSRIYTMVKIEGLTLRGARERIQSDKKAPGDREDVIRSLVNLKSFLEDLKKQLK
jgi:DNA-binding transcriptional MerR regulator